MLILLKKRTPVKPVEPKVASPEAAAFIKYHFRNTLDSAFGFYKWLEIERC
jgi:hypothetical protein